MGNLIANLKHLYLQRGYWIVYAMVGFWFLAIAGLTLATDSKAGEGEFAVLVLLASMMSYFAASLQVAVLSKPFSYCLPGHRKVPRNVIFFLTIVANLLGSALFLVYPDLHLWQRVLVFCSAFCAGILFSWIGVLLAFNVRNPGLCIGLLLLFGFGWEFVDLHKIIERIIVAHPFTFILPGVLSSLVAWRLLGDPNQARRHCGVPILPVFYAWNRKKVQRYSQACAEAVNKKFKELPSPWVEEFFLAGMNRCRYGGCGRYIWGGLYTTFGLVLSKSKACFLGLLLVLSIVFFFSYMSPGATTIFFYLAGAMTVTMGLPVYGSIPIPQGRRERFAVTIVIAVTIALLIAGAMVIVSFLSVTLGPFMPPIKLQGSTYTFYPARMRGVVFPSIIVPIVLTLGLCFRRSLFTASSSTIFLFTILVVTGMPWLLAFVAMTKPILLVAILGMSWLIFIAVLWYVCMRRSVVGQSRTY